MKSIVLTAALALLALAALGGATGQADAAFPGQNGRIVFASDRDGNLELYSVSPNGSNLRRLTNNAANDIQPVVSPDGTRVAFASDRDGDFEIYTMNAEDGSGVTRVTNNPADETDPAFSQTGVQIAFVSDRGFGDADIYVRVGDNERLLTNDSSDPTPPNDDSPAFSPDGDRIAFESGRLTGGNGEIYTMDALNGANVRRLTANLPGDFDPSWSPDGERITFMSQRLNDQGTNNQSVFVMNESGTGQQRLTNRRGQTLTSDSQPAFSPDGERIVFVRSNDLVTMTASGSVLGNVTSHPARDIQPDWGPQPGTAGCTILGSNGVDVLDGTPARDVICGLGGNDTLRGLGGNDELHGGAGNDTVIGGDGGDLVDGGEGDDVVDTRDGVQVNDIADGGQGANDTCRVDPGDLTRRCP
jgi:Tol biopolymer transport system component